MLKHILEKHNITSLNEMQEASLKAFEKGRDVVILSPTGSGKTLAFLLPVIQKLNIDVPKVQCLIVVPSRELAIQIEQVFRKSSTGFKVNCCYGGHAAKTELNNLEHPPAVLIGTPGRLAWHIANASFDTSTVQMLVLDEFDKALEFGFKEDMSYIIGHLKNLKQRMLTCATNTLKIPEFTGVNDPIHLNYLLKDTPKRLLLKAVKSVGNDKLETLFSLLCYLGNTSTLVFCNHREAVDRISELLINRGIGHDVFHGGMEQDERERALIKFRNGTHRILITTDLAARGLDIPEIESIIHYQLPQTDAAYVHRNGRTARMHANGTSYIILKEDEKIPEYLKKSPEFIQLPPHNELPEKSEWTTVYIGAGKKDKINKVDIVGLLLQKGQLAKEDVGLIEVLDFSSYVAVKANQAKKLLGLIKNEKIKKRSVKIEIAR